MADGATPDANAFKFTIRDGDNLNDTSWYIPRPEGHKIFGYDDNITYPEMMGFGDGLFYDGENIQLDLHSVAFTGDFAELINPPEIPELIQPDWNQTDENYMDYIWNKPELATVATSGSYNDLSNKPAARSQSSASRSLNSCYQISSTRDTMVNYTVEIVSTLSLTSGEVGSVFLEIYSDSGCSTGTQELTRFVNGNSGTLAIGLNLSQDVAGTVSGYVPAGSYVKIRTANTSGTPSFTYRSGQEVLF